MKKYVAITTLLLACWLIGFGVFVPQDKYANNSIVTIVLVVSITLVVHGIMELTRIEARVRFMLEKARKLK